MEFEEARQILVAILHSESPMITDQYGASRRLSAIVDIVAAHTTGGSFSYTEVGQKGTLHCQPDTPAGSGEAKDADV
jgi:hypothetical protein